MRFGKNSLLQKEKKRMKEEQAQLAVDNKTVTDISEVTANVSPGSPGLQQKLYATL